MYKVQIDSIWICFVVTRPDVLYTSVALPILFQIHRIYHSTKKSNATHNMKHIKHKLLENKNLYISATENKRNKT